MTEVWLALEFGTTGFEQASVFSSLELAQEYARSREDEGSIVICPALVDCPEVNWMMQQ